jgi:4-amino-4-deoxy-L-arabinose transferase-like glycosyltransferase
LTTVRRDLIALAFVAALLFVPWLGARDLWNPNEPLYGQAVTEMAARGDWLVPTVNGSVFDEKPILYFWLALVASSVLGGVSEATLRIPSVAAGVIAVLLLYLLVEPYAGRRRAGLAGLVLASTFIVFWSARQAQMDLLLTVSVLAAVFFAGRVMDHDANPAVGWSSVGAAVGVGFLAKGPVGLLCPALVVMTYAIATRRMRGLQLRAIPWAAVTFLLVAAPWYLMLWWRGESSFLTELLYRQNLLRFVEPWDHVRPWWYFLQYFWIDMAPWSFFLPLAWGLRPADERQDRLQRLAWTWIFVIVIFFSFSASKRSPYILPVAPAMAILVAGFAERWFAGGCGKWRTRLARLLHAALGLVFAAAGYLLVSGSWIADPPDGLERPAQLVGAISLLGGLLVLGALVAQHRRRIIASAALLGTVGAIYLVASARVLPAANAFKSHRALSESITAHVAPDQPLRGFHQWRWRASYSFYAGRPIPNIESRAALLEYWARPEEVFLIVERGRLEEVRALLGPVVPLLARSVGSNRAYLFSNRQPASRAGQGE